MLHTLRAKILFINLSTLALTLLVVLVFSSQKMKTMMQEKEQVQVKTTLDLMELNLTGQYNYLTQTNWAQLQFRRKTLQTITAELHVSLKSFHKLQENSTVTTNEAQRRALSWLSRSPSRTRGDKDVIVFNENGTLLTSTLSVIPPSLDLKYIKSSPEFDQEKSVTLGGTSVSGRFSRLSFPGHPFPDTFRKFAFLSPGAAWGWTIAVVDDLSMYEPHSGEVSAKLVNLLREMFEKTEIGPGGFATLVDRRGNCLTHIDNEACNILHTAQTREGRLLITEIISNKGSVQTIQAIMGKDSHTVETFHFAPLGWHIIICTPNSGMEQQTRELTLNNTVSLAILFLAASLLSMLIITRSSAHITRLVDTADKIAEGNLEHPVGLFPNDEIGTFARHFERMRTALKKHINELDSQVRERTIRVNQQNAELRQTSRQLEDMVKCLATAKERAERADQEKSRFLAGMSHEIRTPLNAILGTGQLLGETSLTQKQSDYVRVLQSAGGHLSHLLNDILDLSRVEAGKLDLENELFSLKELMEDVWAFSPFRDDLKPIEHILHPPGPEIPSILKGDPHRLRQILLNLLSNANKFTEKGSITLGVSLREFSPRSVQLKFYITDTGIGISRDKQERIFERFVQCDSSLSRKYQGAGLGLAICNHLVNLMNGTIGVDSHPGTGSTFTFSIRLEIPTPDETAALDSPPLASGAHHAHKKYSLLIAEDSENNRMLLDFFLQDSPFEVTMAEDGLEAVQAFRSGTFDIVLMDLRMPHMDGYGATNAIREYETEAALPAVPIISLTADVIKADPHKTPETLFSDTLTKPVSKEKLLEVLLRHTAG